MVDHESQIEALERFMEGREVVVPWDVFVKLDEGTHRAGLELESQNLRKVIQKVGKSEATSLYGFYCHAGRSYSCCSEDDAADLLRHEVEALVKATLIQRELVPERPLVLSFGATPTVHVIDTLGKKLLPNNCTLELHGGKSFEDLGNITVADI